MKRREDGSFMISQPRYIDKIVEEAGLSACKPSKIPLDTGYYKQDQSQALESNEEYRKLIGMVLYLATNTRPDIAASVSILSRKVASPSRADLSELHRLVRYLRGTRDLKLRLSEDDELGDFYGYSDSDCAENIVDRKSNSGFVIRVKGGTVS